MVMYSRGKIYKIVSSHTDKVYIGSTCELLCVRMAKHRASYKSWLAGKRKKGCASFEILKYDDAIIVLLADNLNVSTKEQLVKIEQDYQDLYAEYKTNRQKAYTGLTFEEYQLQYRKTHKEQKAVTDKIYAQSNKEKIAERKKQFYQNNKEELKMRAKQYRLENYEAIKAKASQEYTCECGSTFQVSRKSVHVKTNKHLKYIENATKTDEPITVTN